jgi:DNA repair protein RadC
VEENLHAQHRRRLKQRFLEQGPDSFEPHVLLELLLTYSIARRDTNALAHRLINRFGSLRGVFEADFEALCSVEGVGEHSAVLLKLVPELTRRYFDEDSSNLRQLLTTEDVKQFVLPKFIGKRNEMLMIVFLGNKNQILKGEFLQEGSINSVHVNLRQIVERAVLVKASGVVMAHNHPGGFAIPSNEDISATRALQSVLLPLGINLLDHLVVADNDFVSMRESMMLE